MKNLLSLLAVLFTIGLSAQTAPAKLQIFLDCDWRCDDDYLQQELKYVNFMRDRQEAEVFMQMIRQRSGNGGNQFSLQITGQESYAGMMDTLVFFTNPEDSDGVVRKAMLDNMQKALLPFLVKSDWSEKLSFTVDVPDQDSVVKDVVEDPWDNWVFRLSANGNVSGEQNFKRFNLNGRFNVSRVTAESKLFVSASLNNNSSEFKLEDETINTENNSANLFMLYAKSLSDHWSVGAFGNLRTSDFSNLKSSWSFKPAIEYSFVPYSENTTRELKALYRIGPVGNVYTDTTTFNVLEETLVQQNLNIEYKLIKDWGSIEFDINAKNYIRDFKQSSISFSPGIEWNVFKGFSLELFMDFTYIADRINISKDALSDEEILLGIRQLDSSFSYFSYFGISYRFGSQINNVVNTRF